MKNLMSKVLQWLTNGKNVVLATIIANSGSTPRGAGARMAVISDGSFAGTIGGGALEYKVQQMALDTLKSPAGGKSQTKSFYLSPNEKEDLGMICGGDVTVYLQYISCEDKNARNLFEYAVELFSQNIDSWIVTDITDEAEWRMGIFAEGSKYQLPDVPDKPAENKKELFTNRGVQVEIAGRKYYSEPLTKAGKAYVFGGGHIAQELVPLLSNLGFGCILFDSLEKFANKELFPSAEKIVVGDFENISANTAITEKDYVVIMTRGHKFDYAVEAQVMKQKPYYIGVIGSRNKIASIREKLLEEGFSRDEIDHVHSPIGIAIKADTPAEIAVSIAAELIQIRAARYSTA